ncbi:MAG TPA: hypothetical protein VHC96_21665 [Puia sp.]|jgi:hypothetical protein|nr:hypothetical protein [Puia sp.]
MNPLSPEEKQSHHEAIGKYVRKINETFSRGNGERDMELIQVAYGIRVEDAYFYFDYPYDPSADVLNDALKQDATIGGLDVRVHNLFFSLQEEGQFGYIQFRYGYDQEKKTFLLYGTSTNLAILPADVRTYLPLVHCAVTNALNYSDAVVDAVSGQPDNNLLILCKRHNSEYPMPGQDSTSEDTNIVICTLRILDPALQPEHRVRQLYEDVVYFMETYFISPVAGKILQERRRSEALAYDHSLNNLELDDCIDFVELFSKKLPAEKKTIDEVTVRFRMLRLLHFCLFQSEYIRAGSPGLNRSSALIELENKSVIQILEYIIGNYNLYGLENRLDQLLPCVTDFIPKNGSKDLEPEVYDILLILLNIWQNASLVALGRGDRTVCITAEDKDNALNLTFRNRGQMEQPYMDYINGQRAEYPASLNANPNKLYRGLEIIRDKCRSYDRKWRTTARVAKEGEHWYTYVNIHFIK